VSSFGAVSYTYAIGKYEVTAGQYTEFLNAKATVTDPYALYNTSMSDPTNYVLGCNIQRHGSPDNYAYSVASDWANRPVNYVSFWDAARFTNWLCNGQGNGDTETGAYTLNGYLGTDGGTIARNASAKYWIPSEDEWYKAAYYDPSKSGGAGYWDYPTKSNSKPSNVFSSTGTNNANYHNSSYTIGSPYYQTEVGAFANSVSAYGTFDQGGNVQEWNDTLSSGSSRGLRGGDGGGYSYFLAASCRTTTAPSLDGVGLGFRVASVPEPGSITLLIVGAIAALILRRRRK
jgi:formylglycine-generating enzyme